MLKALVRERVAATYRQALRGGTGLQLDVHDAATFLTRQKYAETQSRRDNDLLGALDIAKEQLADHRARAERARADADAERVRIESAKTSIEAATAQQRQLLGQVQGELARLVAEEVQRRQAAALAAAQRQFGGGSGDGNPEAFPNLPAPGPAAAAAIAFGRSQLGKPYVYAAAGPDAYDCSGLVMAAYAAAGISLPHYSGAQYQALPHVPLDAMQPGDLLFWGVGGSMHSAIYLGAGRILEAGGTGDNVHIGPIWGSPVGAARAA
jgi:peptidoglycan DL-endopeptidase CwlO